MVTQELWRELDCFLGGCSTVSYQVDPPESVVALFHPNILQALLKVMDVKLAQKLQSIEGVCRQLDVECVRKFELADSHCHLIPTLKNWCCNNVSELSSQVLDLPGDYEEPVMICNISHEGCWGRWKSLENEDNVLCSASIHWKPTSHSA